MIRRLEWNVLKRYVKKYNVKLRVLSDQIFTENYGDLVWSVFNPQLNTIVVNNKCVSDENLLFFAVAHELGHAIDHISEPDHSRMYGLHFHISKIYHMFSISEPQETINIFTKRENMADDIALNILRKLNIQVNVLIGDKHYITP